MKTLTCSQMGGACDAEISGATEDELMANSMHHLEEAHPDMAAQIKAMPKDDPAIIAWSRKFHDLYEAAPNH